MSPYNLEYNDPKYAGYTYDNGTDSFIKKEVDTWYKNALGNTEYDSKVLGGRFCSDSSGYRTDEMFDNVYASYDRLGQNDNNFAKPNAPTLKCPSTSESYGGSYRLKAGLITADELVFAGENLGVVTDSYLNPGSYNMEYWSITPAAFAYNRADVYLAAYDLNFVSVANANANAEYKSIRPIINIDANSRFTSGDGTASNPYIIN